MLSRPHNVRSLVWVTVAVLCLHGVLLGGLPQSLGWVLNTQDAEANNARPFVTRTIDVPVLVPVPVPVSVLELTPAAPTAVARALPINRVQPAAEAASVAVETTPPAALGVNPAAAPVQQAQEAIETIAKSDPISTANENPRPPPAPASGSAAVMAAAAVTVPAPVRLKYDIKGEIKGFPYTANADLLWLQDGKTYDARLEVSVLLLGSRIQTSKGLLSPQGLEPIRFGDKFRSEVAAHFERSKGKIIFSANTPDVDLLPGAQDQLSVLLQVASLINGDPTKFTKGTELAFQAVGPRSAENWVFTAGTLEKLNLPGGEMQGLKFTRPAVNDYDPRMEIWFGPDIGYLPIRVRLTQSNGDFVDQMWRGTQKP